MFNMILHGIKVNLVPNLSRQKETIKTLETETVTKFLVMSAVYFDQQTGALHAVRWLKSFVFA